MAPGGGLASPDSGAELRPPRHPLFWSGRLAPGHRPCDWARAIGPEQGITLPDIRLLASRHMWGHRVPHFAGQPHRVPAPALPGAGSGVIAWRCRHSVESFCGIVELFSPTLARNTTKLLHTAPRGLPGTRAGAQRRGLPRRGAADRSGSEDPRGLCGPMRSFSDWPDGSSPPWRWGACCWGDA